MTKIPTWEIGYKIYFIHSIQYNILYPTFHNTKKTRTKQRVILFIH